MTSLTNSFRFRDLKSCVAGNRLAQLCKAHNVDLSVAYGSGHIPYISKFSASMLARLAEGWPEMVIEDSAECWKAMCWTQHAEDLYVSEKRFPMMTESEARQFQRVHSDAAVEIVAGPDGEDARAFVTWSGKEYRMNLSGKSVPAHAAAKVRRTDGNSCVAIMRKNASVLVKLFTTFLLDDVVRLSSTTLTDEVELPCVKRSRYIKLGRPGQAPFSRDVARAYGKRCAVTGSTYALDAAHIREAAGGGDIDPSNGILMRKDIHALFDRNYLAVHPETQLVHIHPVLLGEDCGRYHYTPLACRQDGSLLNIPALTERWKRFLEAGGKL